MWCLVNDANDSDLGAIPFIHSFFKWPELPLQALRWVPCLHLGACDCLGPELCCWFFFFFFFGEKVDQVFSLSLLWMLSLSAWRQGSLRPWRLDQATSRSAALRSLSGPKSSTFAFNKEELDLEAVEGLWCQHSWKGPGSWRAAITLPLGQFPGYGHLPLQSPGSLALLH